MVRQQIHQQLCQLRLNLRQLLRKMKLFLRVEDFLSCKTCVGSNVGDCLGNATIVECQENETTCEVTMRKRRGGTYFVQMGCKALDACLNNKSNNAKGPWKQQECKPYNNVKIQNSVCRQCCDGGMDCVETNFFNAAGTDGTQNRQNWINDFVTQDDPTL